MSIRRMSVLILWAGIFAACVHYTTDPDLWWHLKTGEYILSHGVPHADVFSYTIKGQSLLAHESLFQIALWAVYRFGGLPAIMLTAAFLSALTLWVAYKACVGRPYLAMFVVILLTLPVFASITAPRPQLVTALMVSILVYIIEKVKDGTLNSKSFFVFPFLFVIWANCHGGFVYGIVILAIYAAGESLEQLSKKGSERNLNWGQIKHLGLSLFAGFLATGLNPNGLHLWVYPFYQAVGHAQQAHVTEWQSPSFHAWYNWPFVIMMGVSILAWVFTQKMPSLTETLLFLATAAAGFLSVRHMAFFAIVNSPMLSRYLLECFKNTPLYSEFKGSAKKPKLTQTRSFLHCLFVALTIAAGGVWVADMVSNNEKQIAKTCPVAAVEYIQMNGLDKKKIFNDYDWGGYLIWRDIPVFIDGRAEVYGDKFIDSYFKTLDINSKWYDAIDRYEADYILLNSQRPLTTILRESRDWQKVYEDKLAVIFTRNNSKT